MPAFRSSSLRRLGLLAAPALLFAGAMPARAADGLDLAFKHVADLSVAAENGADRHLRYLHRTDIVLDGDLAKLAGIDNAVFHVDVMHTAGARPNDSAGTLEGTDNVEVDRAALRLFEAWAEKSWGSTSLRAGLYDLNSEFYATPSAGLLIAPPFGIGSEMAATGPNGPSIFPSTALALCLRTALPLPGGYAQAVVANARAQTFGDPGGVDLTFGDGLLAVAEAGGGERLHAEFGGWTYTRPSDALASLDPSGQPLRSRTHGAYAALEYHVLSGKPRELTTFARFGVAGGGSAPFAHSFQAGLLLSPALATRPDSAFSLGLHTARTSAESRSAQRLAGEPAVTAERAIEATWSDAVAPFLTLQPDVQWIQRRTEGVGAAPAILQLTLRFVVSLH